MGGSINFIGSTYINANKNRRSYDTRIMQPSRYSEDREIPDYIKNLIDSEISVKVLDYIHSNKSEILNDIIVKNDALKKIINDDLRKIRESEIEKKKEHDNFYWTKQREMGRVQNYQTVKIGTDQF